MRSLVASCLLAGLLAVAPAGAHASGESYKGGCGMIFQSDQTPGGQLGGPTVWNGVVYLFVAGLDGSGLPTSEVTASCELRVNGNPQPFVVLGPTSGLGVVALAGRITFTAEPADVVELCDRVYVNGSYVDDSPCHVQHPVPGVPPEVFTILGIVVGTVESAPGVVRDTINPTLCPALVSAAPTVDGLNQPELVYMGNDGDLYLLGTGSDDLVYNCS
jgi:hypothetical protein